MLIVKVHGSQGIERALKELKGKVIKTKQNNMLIDRKEFKKKSVTRREQIKKAKYVQSVKDREQLQ